MIPVTVKTLNSFRLSFFIGLFRKKLKKFKKKVNSTCKLEELCYNEKADTGKLQITVQKFCFGCCIFRNKMNGNTYIEEKIDGQQRGKK